MSDKPTDPLIGKRLGQYEIVDEIGRGGMATVYSARQLSMNRTVAVKVLPRHLMHDPGFVERFEREVEVITQLEHPHILPIYDYGTADDVPYIAMRYLGGGSMDQMVRRNLPRLQDLERPLRQIAQALDHAHRQGVIHRDLKPGNIMLDEHGNAYLSDFGIARVLGSNLTGSMIVGTPAYMSPEQANGLPLDGRSDIYSLGVVLFELLTGRGPYEAETPMALLLKHINEPMPPISQYRRDVPPGVEAVVAKATAKDPNDRYISATKMMEDFSTALRGMDMVDDDAVATMAIPASETGSTPKPPTGSPARTTDIPQRTENQPAPQPTMVESAAATGAPITGTMEPAGRGVSNLVLFLIVLVLLLAGFAAVAALALVNPPTLTVDAAPTAFPRASIIERNEYSISMLDNWIPPSLFLDRSDDDRLMHVWQNGDEAYVSLALVEADVRADAFAAAVSAYDDAYYGNSSLDAFDEATAEDGTLRRSYRLPDGGDLLPGQLDVFYIPRAPYLAVVEMYTADTVGNQHIPNLQLILDSLRIKAAS